MMPFTKQHSAYARVVTCILVLINLTFHNLALHSSYKIHQQITDYCSRLAYSELIEKPLFRSRANRRLVLSVCASSSALCFPCWQVRGSTSVRGHSWQRYTHEGSPTFAFSRAWMTPKKRCLQDCARSYLWTTKRTRQLGLTWPCCCQFVSLAAPVDCWRTTPC